MTEFSISTFSGDDAPRLLRRAWHPVALSQDLAGGAVRGARLLGQELVLARLSEGLLAADVACPHKGTRLSLGSVCDGDLRCPTHDWRFDASGHCVNLPPLLDPSLQKMATAALQVYRVAEKFGVVWVQLENDPETSIPDVPELHRSHWSLHFGTPLPFQCGFRRATDGFLDVTEYLPESGHLSNLYHENFNGGNHEPVGFAARANFPEEDEPGVGTTPAHERRYRCYPPNIITIRQKWEYGERLWLFLASPVTLTTCQILWGLALAPGFEGPDIEAQLEAAQAKLETVRRTCESQLPEETPMEQSRCGWGVLVTPGDVLSDQFQRAFRLWVLQLKAMGK
jgi:nitrite reductase/ring-hydroxylating ferredoxin subunit